MKVLSLFDGISCARVALSRAGIPVDVYCASEIDKYAISISKRHYPDIIHLGDVKKLSYDFLNKHEQNEYLKKVFDFDLLIGGSPCQDLSIAKKNREGLRGGRSSLFFEYVRILKELRPKFFILENVFSMSKESKETITKELFGIEPVMIDAALVSAQTRKRLFWIGKRTDDGYEKVKVNQPEDRGIVLNDIAEEDFDEKYVIKNIGNKRVIQGSRNGNEKARCLGATAYKGAGANGMTNIRVGTIGKDAQGNRIYDPRGKATTLSAQGGGRGAKTGLYAFPCALRNRGEGKKPEFNGTGKANAITTVQTDSVIFNGEIIRRLMPIEAERLQCLPDKYTEGLSDTQRYKCLGNGFNVEVIKHILQEINML